jgi:single-stranded DNA-binding protein
MRTAKSGKTWTRLRVGVGKDDAVQWVNVAVFGKAAETATTLKKGDRIYCEGSIKLDIWTGSDGIERHTLAVAAFKCDQTHKIGRAREKPTNKPAQGEQRSTNTDADNLNLNDEIPF